MELKTCQLCLLRSIKTKGWPVDLQDHLLARCGASEAQLSSLLAAGLVESSGGRLGLTKAGKKEFTTQSRNRWF